MRDRGGRGRCGSENPTAVAARLGFRGDGARKIYRRHIGGRGISRASRPCGRSYGTPCRASAGRVLPRRAVAIRFRHPASPDGVRSANLDQASGARQAALAAGGGIRFGPTLTGSRNRCRPSRRLPSQAAGTKSRADARSQGQLYASRSSGSFSPLSSRIWDEMCTAIEPSSLKIQTERAHRTLPACRRTISASTILLLGMPCRWLPLSSNASDRARNSAEVIIVAVAIRSFSAPTLPLLK